MKRKILIVDDEQAIADLVEVYLSNEGMEVLKCYNGKDALDCIRKEELSLAILDVMLPDIDGYKLCQEIRKEHFYPVIMLTARTEDTDKILGLTIGADDYMTKPIDEEEMLLRIKALLRRAQIVNERRITIGDTVLDYDTFTVSRSGQTQELPQKEFLLLYKLLSYPGRIFTRIQLMDEIWGSDSDTGWETVTVHIGRLRKRFEGWDAFEIISVRGLGYKAVRKK